MQPGASKATFVGLFFVTLATLMYEILLTRIFSVTMWYHFAFVAISVALLGMTVGALVVYLFPSIFAPARAKQQLGWSASLFALTVVWSFLTHLSIPFILDLSFVGLYSIAFTYLVLTVPFIFSGIAVCLALTRFPSQISKLYAADLAGAALGCIVVVFTLGLTDGPTAVFVVASLANLGAVCFALENRRSRLFKLTVATSALLLLFSGFNTVLVNNQNPLVRLLWFKGEREPIPLYEKWNSFSRIAVSGDPNSPTTPFGWGFSPVYSRDTKIAQLGLTMDAGAGTVLTAFNGDLQKVNYLRYDVTNVVHHLRSGANVLVVGVGGGRDVLSALLFNQKSVRAVEINEDIIRAVNQRFGNFTGHLDRDPRVTFVNDEARSYIARQSDKFDIIEVSLVDTFAATAAGAFVLTENSIYTTEAWKIFLNHLTPGGVLSVSRWYSPGQPGEAYRMTSIAAAALSELGINNPRQNIALVGCSCKWSSDTPGIATILVSTQPLSAQDLSAIDTVASDLKFDVLLSPRVSPDATFAQIATGFGPTTVNGNLPLNVSAPTDDNPFFFQMIRLQDVFSGQVLTRGITNPNVRAVWVLGVLLLIVTGLTILFVFVPLMWSSRQGRRGGSLTLTTFFASIGLGFILIEVSQMQRLIIFLGHPTYSLSVVLFTLLLASSLGSRLTDRITIGSSTSAGTRRLVIVLLLLLGFGSATPFLLIWFQDAMTPLRILVAVAILFPLGLFMGMPFPIGISLATKRDADLTPWLWGINGATSVVASVLAVVIALAAGISAAFWTGFICYALALLAFVFATRRQMSVQSEIIATAPTGE